MNHLARWPIDRETGRARRPAEPRTGRGRINAALPVDPREVLREVAAQRGETLTELSRMLSRDEGYLGRFVREGVPIALSARDHQLLADHFGMTGRELGIRDVWGERAREW